MKTLDLTTPDGAHLYGLTIGEGPIPLLLIPGAGDGLSTAREAAWNLAWYLRPRLKRYRILYLSRREPIPPGFGIEQHAEDYLWALGALGWGPVVLECNSGGGPIGQWMAVKRPDWVRGLVLSCTMHRTSDQTRDVLAGWLALAREGRWTDFNWSSIALTFRPKTVRRYRPFRPLLGLIRPRNPERLLRVLEGLLAIDQRPLLPRITCPTLVFGGEEDRVIPAAIQREMAALIPRSRLRLCPGYGHGADQEHPAYLDELRRLAEEAWDREETP